MVLEPTRVNPPKQHLSWFSHFCRAREKRYQLRQTNSTTCEIHSNSQHLAPMLAVQANNTVKLLCVQLRKKYTAEVTELKQQLESKESKIRSLEEQLRLLQSSDGAPYSSNVKRIH